MLRGYRSKFITIAGLALVTILLSFLVRDLSAVDSAYRHAAADSSIKYQRNSEAYIKERCFSPAGLREVDCAAEAREAAREGQRKEQDLAAQNITAWWTKVMGIAALIGMALSAVGVWLVKTTFDETQKANVLTKLGQRPWLSVEVKEIGPLRIDENRCYMIDHALSVTNTGGRPATKICDMVAVATSIEEITNDHEKLTEAISRALAPSAVEPFDARAPLFGYQRMVDAWFDPEKQHFLVIVIYCDGDEGTQHYTAHEVRILSEIRTIAPQTKHALSWAVTKTYMT